LWSSKPSRTSDSPAGSRPSTRSRHGAGVCQGTAIETSGAFSFTPLSAPAGAGKGAPAAPVEVKRVRPQISGKTVPKEAVPNVDQYPFARLIGELEGRGSPQSGRPEASADAAPASEAPKDWPMQRDVPLSPTAREALNVSQPWMTEKQVPAPGKE